MEYAQLRPANVLAQTITREVRAWVVNSQDEFHDKFYDESIVEASDSSGDASNSNIEYDTEPSSTSEQATQEYHFTFSFHHDEMPVYPKLGHRVGKGDSTVQFHGVEFLLAKPGSKDRKYLSVVHCFFRFNPNSGILMLASGTRHKSLEIFVNGEWKRLAFGEQYALYRKTTRLRLDKLEYEFVYTVPPEQSIAFVVERSAWIQDFLGKAVVPDRLWPLSALDTSILRGPVLTYGSKAYGTFGWVYKGLDPTTGDPVAVKESNIRNARERKQNIAEMEIGRAFQGVPGLLPVLHSWCEHNNSRPCGIYPEKFYLSFPLASKDFFELSKQRFWATPSYSHSNFLSLFYQPLLGLSNLHNRGYMHRDITCKNLLVLSYDPPVSALCDYGKTCKAEKDESTCLGPIRTLAPEVWQGPYTNTIDLWAWGIAVAECLGYLFADNEPINKIRLGHIHYFLERFRCAESWEEQLVGLIAEILKWEVSERTTLEQALRHSCWGKKVEAKVKDDQQGIKHKRNSEDNEQAKYARTATDPIQRSQSKLSSPARAGKESLAEAGKAIEQDQTQALGPEVYEAFKARSL